MIQKCVPAEEWTSIMEACHSSPYGGHAGPAKTAAKILQSGFFGHHCLKIHIILLKPVIDVKG